MPNTTHAPYFDERRVRDYTDTVTLLLDQAQIINEDSRIKFLVRYSSDRVRETIQYEEEFDEDSTGKVYADAVAKLKELYESLDKPPTRSLADLQAFCKQMSQQSFSSSTDVDNYRKSFLAISSVLKKTGQCTDAVINQHFVAGIPDSIREWFVTSLPANNRTGATAPTISAAVALLKSRFDPTGLLYQPWAQEEPTVYFDEFGRRVGAKDIVITGLGPSRNVIQPAVSANPPTALPTRTAPRQPVQAQDQDINDLTDRLRSMSLDQITALLHASGLSALAPGSLNNLVTQGQPLANNSSFQQLPRSNRCFMCGLSDTHPLGIAQCPETAKLVEAHIVKFDLDTRRYVQMDGQALPQVPRSYPGGVAAALRTSGRTSSFQGRDLPPHMSRSTNMIGLTDDLGDVLGRSVFAIESSSSYPITRSGKDTTKVRFDPAAGKDSRLSGTRPGAQENRQPRPATPPAALAPRAPPPAPKIVQIPAPQNPINRQDGWKDSQPSRSKTQDDVPMRDGTKKTPGNTGPYHITTDVQDRIKTDQVLEKILQAKVEVPVLELIGSSPSLQKMVNEMTKTKRSYKGSTSHLERDPWEHDYVEEVPFEAIDPRPVQYTEADVRRAYMDEDGDMDTVPEILTRYSNAIASVPTDKYYAMVTGYVTARIGDETFTCLVDGGSELNVCESGVVDRTGVPIDFDGTQWSLKGIHGEPERLKGVAHDVPLTIGSRDFPHHFFVSRHSLGRHQIILGQPFFQWYAAQIQYHRAGQVKLYLWEDGNEEGGRRPSISLTITKPGDPRNATHIDSRPGTSKKVQQKRVQKVQIEEIYDSDDDDAVFRR